MHAKDLVSHLCRFIFFVLLNTPQMYGMATDLAQGEKQLDNPGIFWVQKEKLLEDPDIAAFTRALEIMATPKAGTKPNSSALHKLFSPLGTESVISIYNYLLRIKAYTLYSPECFIVALIYMDRLVCNPECTNLIDNFTIHRIFLTAITLAYKFAEDTYYTNEYYARVGGVTTEELNELELKFFAYICCDFYVSLEEFRTWQSYINNLKNDHPKTKISQASVNAFDLQQLNCTLSKLTKLLVQITQEQPNSLQNPSELYKILSSVKMPQTRIEDYIQSLQQNMGCHAAYFFLAFIYINRLEEATAATDNFTLTDQVTIRQLFLTATVIACNSLGYTDLTDEHCANVGKISIDELNQLKQAFLESINNNLFVSFEELNNIIDYVDEFMDRIP